jgi:pilus assembly protein CpaE
MSPSFTGQGKIRVLVIPGPDPVGDWMANTIQGQTDMVLLGLVRDISQALDAVRKQQPDVILLDISSGVLQESDLINRLAAPLSGAAVIAVAMMGEVDTVRQAMLYGAQGFLLKPFGETELLTSVRQAYELIVLRRSELSGVPKLAPAPEPEEAPTAQIIAVYSPKGGVGSTTIAINLAVALKALTGEPVILMDGDLRFGDIDAALNITATANIGTLLPALDTLDDHTLRRALMTHASGIKVLAAPPYLDMADTFEPEQIGRLLTRLASLDKGFVVVDAWSALDDFALAILDASQRIVIVTTPQVTALRDTHRFLEVIKLLNYDSDKFVLVVNNCYQRSELKIKEVERILEKPIVQTIEYTPGQVNASLNRGMPLVQAYDTSPAAQDILQLAHLVSTKPGEEPPPRRLEVEPVVEQKQKAKPRRRLFSRRA